MTFSDQRRTPRRGCGGGRHTAFPAVPGSVEGVENDAGIDDRGCEQCGGGRHSQQTGNQKAKSLCLRLLSRAATCRPTGVRGRHAAGMTGGPGCGRGWDAAGPMFLGVPGSVGRDQGQAGDQGRCCEQGGGGHHGQQPNGQQAKSSCHLRLLSGATCRPAGVRSHDSTGMPSTDDTTQRRRWCVAASGQRRGWGCEPDRVDRPCLHEGTVQAGKGAGRLWPCRATGGAWRHRGR